MQNKTVLITGTSRGVGKAMREKFVAEGYAVLAPARSELDLSSGESIAGYIKKNATAAIDIIVNNAGINKLAPFDAVSKEDFDETLQVNLKGPFQLVQGFFPGMKKRGYGRVVNIGSIWGMVSKSGRLTYTASKTALIGITRTLAIELAPYGILVNAVCPGFIDTDLTMTNLGPEGIKEIQKQIPMRRLANANEIAEVVFFLCSEKNTYLTGQAVIVDGGYTIQ
jgi:3-oxoacyl-[acyl-carrier protein] reductase